MSKAQNTGLGSNSGNQQISLTEKDKKQVLKCIQECDGALTRILGEKTLIKEAVSKVVEDTGISKRVLNRMIKVHHKANYPAELQEFQDFENTYDDVVINAKPEPKIAQ